MCEPVGLRHAAGVVRRSAQLDMRIPSRQPIRVRVLQMQIQFWREGSALVGEPAVRQSTTGVRGRKAHFDLVAMREEHLTAREDRQQAGEGHRQRPQQALLRRDRPVLHGPAFPKVKTTIVSGAVPVWVLQVA